MSDRRRDDYDDRRGDDRGERRRFEERGEERRSFREDRGGRRGDDRDDDRGARRERRGDRERDREPRQRSRSAGGGGGGGGEERKRSRTPSPAAARMKSRPSGFDQKQMLPENYAMMQMALMKTPPPMQGGGGMGAGGGMGGGGGMGAGMGGMMMPPTNTVTNPEVELFLQHNPVEPHAATRLRSLPVELQKIVLSRGSLFGGRDPTAVLLGRVRAATRGQSGPMMGGGVPWSGTTAVTPTPTPAPTPAPMPQASQDYGNAQKANSPWGTGGNDDTAAWARGGTGGGYQQQSQAADEPWQTEQFGTDGDSRSAQPKSARNKVPPKMQVPQGPPPDPNNPQETAFRGQMQNSIGELSTKLLGQNAAAAAGLVEEQEEEVKGGRPAAAAPALNPFRSKPRAAPVATEPDPLPMETSPMDFNLTHTPAPNTQPDMGPPQQAQQPPSFSPPPMSDLPLALPQERPPQREPEKPSGGFLFNDTPSGGNTAPAGMPSMPPPLGKNLPPGFQTVETPSSAPQQRLWSPSAQDLADLGVPPGIAVRMIRQNKILADEENMPIIPYEGGAPITANDDADDAPNTGGGDQAKSKDFPPSSAGTKIPNPTDMPKADGSGGPDDVKRAQAIATLSYYGLTDPNNQEDVAKAVQAVAAATGDQATAVALWHQMMGTSSEGVQVLTEEQQMEVQQAAQHAQYSQYWLQQQFQSQLAMFENQRLMATGDNPVTNVEDARESALRGPRGDPAVAGRRKPSTSQPMLPGDWTCPGCGDHQFARNRVCRFCGASRPIGSH